MYGGRFPGVLITLIIGLVVFILLVVIFASLFGLFLFALPFFGWIFLIIIFFLIIGFMIRVIMSAIFGWPSYRYYRSWGYGPGYQNGTNSKEVEAESILNARYAIGEITREQYMQMRDDLRRRGPGQQPAPGRGNP